MPETNSGDPLNRVCDVLWAVIANTATSTSDRIRACGVLSRMLLARTRIEEQPDSLERAARIRELLRQMDEATHGNVDDMARREALG